ncbi:GntR family transcriptional regulator [Breoghania corrubedonensis]|uniref:GntR family transcriptional regulator n=1 Tax=Breoghania corrubedonensis TaxID=665038 RepID=A0A2T5VF86_9HYPH|nr:GntR family transcriptional regulator [Breoghania corrubedonensis]PTW62421.1 GntR family transcriptional regulator [Breoghania corrubedonensis]
MNAKPDEPDLPTRVVTRDRVVAAVEDALLTGQFVPGHAVTLRGLAAQLGVSPMPVREAIRVLSSANALDVMPNGRIRVPTMTRRRFDELLHARVLLEPHLAALALPNLNAAAGELARIDDAIDESLVSGDVIAYMRRNHEFHFRIYRAAGSEIILPLVEHVWLQFAPFMRTVYGRVGTSVLEDQHKEAIAAIRLGDAEGLRQAIERDILDGMGLIGHSVLDAPPPESGGRREPPQMDPRSPDE